MSRAGPAVRIVVEATCVGCIHHIHDGSECRAMGRVLDMTDPTTPPWCPFLVLAVDEAEAKRGAGR